MKQRNYVIEQAADERVVQRLRRRRVLVVRGDLGVGHERFNQRLQVGVLKALDEIADRTPERVDILVGLGKVIGKIDFGLFQLAQLVHRQLELIVELIDQTLDLDEIVLLERVQEFVHVVPDLGLDLAGAVGQGERDVEIAGAFGLDLFGCHHEARNNSGILVLRTIANEEIFHRVQLQVSRKWLDRPNNVPRS